MSHMWLRGAGFCHTMLIVVGVVLVLAAVAPSAHGAIALPDGRQWEMVSPPSKNGAVISAMNKEGGVAQAAADGGAFTWAANIPIGPEPAGNRAPEWSQIFSTRGAGGWSSRDIAPPNEAAVGPGGSLSEYMFFSSNLSLGLIEEAGETPLSPEASEKTIYLRDTASDSYVPLVTAANVQAGAKFGGNGNPTLAPYFQGASSDLGHIVFSSPEALTPNALQGSNLYEWFGGQLRLVSMLSEREGGAAATEPSLGYLDQDVRQAISSDGSRVVWTNKGSLYMSVPAHGETVRLDVAQGAREPAVAAAQFQTASDDGSRVFFTDDQRLTADSTASPTEDKQDLYVFETTNGEAESLKGTLTDLTVDANASESADVRGLLPGASEDGSYVYFVADGVLGNGAAASAVPGDCKFETTETGEFGTGETCNLYLAHYNGTSWTTAYIARLSGDDAQDWNGQAGAELKRLTSRASPNGRYLAFMSDRELTGYDNEDVSSKSPGERLDEEVFLYYAPANLGAEPGALVCASCNPTGARPVGIFDTGYTEHVSNALLVDEPQVWKGRWLAANIPGWTPMVATRALYQSRYLTDSGRLFFNSSDTLVPEDVDGTEDVYEYEPLGVGGCDGAASGSSAFKPAHTVVVEGGQGEEPAGCVGLISSGSSSEESVFLDASESGGEVFFLTAVKLAPQDYDTSLDVYDAHECTASSPCIAPPAEAPPPCTTPEACRAPSGSQPAIFGAPSSQTFSGAGNATPAPAASATLKAKPPTRAQRLAKALKACGRRPKKKRRACERSAHRRYRASKATTKANKKSRRGRRRA